jgi:hypothetical protein
VCTWYKTSDIEKLYRDGSPSFDTAAVVGFASVGEVEARAWAFDLEVADGTLGIDGRESGEIALGVDGAMMVVVVVVVEQ